MSFDARDFLPTTTRDQRLAYVRHRLDDIRAQLDRLNEADPAGYVVTSRNPLMRGLTLGTDPAGGIRMLGTLYGRAFETVTDATIWLERYLTADNQLTVLSRAVLIADALRQQAEFLTLGEEALAKIERENSRLPDITREVMGWTLTASDQRPDYEGPQIDVESPCGSFQCSGNMAVHEGVAADHQGGEKRVPKRVRDAVEALDDEAFKHFGFV